MLTLRAEWVDQPVFLAKFSDELGFELKCEMVETPQKSTRQVPPDDSVRMLLILLPRSKGPGVVVMGQ